MPVNKFRRMSDAKTKDTLTYINNNYIRVRSGKSSRCSHEGIR